MGFLALKKIQAGLETQRGSAVAASRNVYGTITISREQTNRYANEDRGQFVKFYRANQKLIEAGFKHEQDVLFEDEPYFLETFMQGGVTPTGGATTGYQWTYAPDLSSDLLKTRTYYAGDDSVQWRGAFGVTDSAEYALDLNDAVKVTHDGFVQDWVPFSSSFLPTGFTTPAGGFASIADRAVESVMGYQSRLFVDAAGAIGTTQITGRFVKANWAYKLNGKRLPYGDNLNYALQRYGRGERDIECTLSYEGFDTAQFADLFNKTEKALRIQLIGTVISGTTFGTTNGALNAGTAYTSIVTNALTSAVPGGSVIDVGGVAFTVAPAGAAAAATAIPVISLTPSVTVATGATIMLRKSANYDFWGFYDTWQTSSRDTDTVFDMKLVGVYDSTAGYDHRITVFNQNNQAAGVS